MVSERVAIMNSDNTLSVELTADDLVAINNALNEVCHGPDASLNGSSKLVWAWTERSRSRP